MSSATFVDCETCDWRGDVAPLDLRPVQYCPGCGTRLVRKANADGNDLYANPADAAGRTANADADADADADESDGS